mgnify:CR=1 FL=1
MKFNLKPNDLRFLWLDRNRAEQKAILYESALWRATIEVEQLKSIIFKQELFLNSLLGRTNN